jgi:small subunit ribosomal protein S17
MNKNPVEEQSNKKLVVGRVSSDKMNKTVVVEIERKVKHPLYGKYIKRYTKLYAHDETNQCQVGDIVKIEETKPLSKLKRWKVIEIVNKNQ